MFMRFILLLLARRPCPAKVQTIKEDVAFAVIAELKYAVNFTIMITSTPAAPKGGNVTLSATGIVR